MRIRIATFLASLGFLLWHAPASAADKEEVLELATEIARFLENTRELTDSGLWPDNALQPEQAGFDLASGAAGKVVFLVGMYRATGNDQYLEQATQGADFLLEVLESPETFDGNERRASLYAGISGIGVALLHVMNASSDDKYAAGVRRTMQLLTQWSVAAEPGRRWSNQFNDLIYGDAGTVLFLAHAAEEIGDDKALMLAQEGANLLIARAVESEVGHYWRFRRDKDFNLPNFSHGTAGIAYALATVGHAANHEASSSAAAQGFAYLQSIAEIEGDKVRMPYGWGSDNWIDLYEFGWAHGLAGTALAIIRLQQVGIAVDDARAFELLAQKTLPGIGLPDELSPPFAEPSTPLDIRFGRAGLLPLASYWGQTEFQDALFEHLKSKAIRAEGAAFWEVEAPAFMGGGKTRYTGLFHGAAGIGIALLQVHADLEGKPSYVNLPDNPL